MTNLLPLVLDFETFYDPKGGYTLKKMPTAQYVRDERFASLGAGVRLPGQPAVWLEPEPLRGFLDRVPWDQTLLVAHNCVPADTEVLTPRGWRGIASIPVGALVMQWDPTTGQAAWAPVQATTQARAEGTYEWDTVFHSGSYSPGHRMYFQTPDTSDQWRAEPAETVARRGANNTYIPLAGEFVGGASLFTPLEARLVEAVRADGSYQGSSSFRFALKKGRKIDRLQQLLISLGVEWRSEARPDGATRMFLYACPLTKRIATFLGPEKRYTVQSLLGLNLPSRLSMIDEMRHWDGSDHGCYPAFKWSCADPETVEAVHTVAHLSGWRLSGGWRDNNRGFTAGRDGFRVFSATLRPSRRAKLVEPATYNATPQEVHCVTVPSGAIFVRRKGRIWITGNCQFDGLVLTERYGHKPKEYACTMFMLRWLISQGLLNPRMNTSLDTAAALVGMEKGDMEQALADNTLGEYAATDAAICGALFDKYWHILPEDERGFIDIHVRMATEPVLELDTEALQRLADADKAMEGDGGLFQLARKDDLFASALTALGVNPEYKTTDKGNLKLALAKTDAFMQGLQNHPNELVRLLADIRLKARSTILRTRSQRFLDVGAPLPAPTLYYGAHTGRGSGLDMINVQNLPRKGGLRECVLAPEGHKLVIVDSSQVEVRTNAWLAGQEDLLEDFRQGRDPYLSFASFRYSVGYDSLLARYRAEDPESMRWRQVCKAAVLALGFMQGAGGFEGYCKSNNVPLAEGEAPQVVHTYRNRHQKIVELADNTLNLIRRQGTTPAPNGTKLTYPDLKFEGRDVLWRRPVIFAKSVNEGHSGLWRGSAIENLVQKVARDVVFWQALQMRRAGLRVILMAHDEVVLLTKDEDAEATLEAALAWMQTNPPWAEGLPLGAEGKITDRYTK